MSRLLLFLFVSLFPVFAQAEGFVLNETACEEKLLELINGAEKYIDVSVYSINNKKLVDALAAAHRRGVKVRVLTDKVQAAGVSSRIWDLIDAGIPLRVHTYKRIMHTKVAIYDGLSVSSGSLNWTEPAVHKNEEVCDIFVNDPDYAAQHQRLFDKRWENNSHEKSDLWLKPRLLKRRADQAKQAK